MKSVAREISEARGQYEQLLKEWAKNQVFIDRCLKALANVLETYILFTGTNKGDVELDADKIDRIVYSYANDTVVDEPQTIVYSEAMDTIARIKESKQNEKQNVSPLTANLQNNLPGFIPLFLQHKSESAMKILYEVREMCEKYRAVALPKMEKVCEMAVKHINRQAGSMDQEEVDIAVLEAIHESFIIAVSEVHAVLKMTASISLNPDEKVEQIQAYIDEINAIRIHDVNVYWRLIKSGGKS
ncbi:apolipo A-IV, putative [Babesia ovis]|uniref:Apolipo A-IV, putative n=1 Tax=Babesia ovis TaxID=5869 RepID=A0A9W5TBF8_BABOV|nr:apolipo A-IV, putative [Babesia ovis]